MKPIILYFFKLLQVQAVPQNNGNSYVLSVNGLADSKFVPNDVDTSNIVMDENNQLVANSKYLIENGLVTIRAETATITDSSNTKVTSSDSPKETNSTSRNEQTDDLMEENVSVQIVSSAIEEEAKTNSNNNGQIDNLENSDSLGSCSIKNMCEVCGRGFSKPCLLERHRRVHTGERSFKCDICSKAFAQKSTLQLHHRLHKGDKPNACPECDRSYTQSANLHAHIRRVHKLDPHEAISAKRNALAAQHQFVNLDPRLLGLDDVPIDLLTSFSLPFSANCENTAS